MEVLFFLKQRTEFIRNFYEEAGAPFREKMRKIEAGEAPFDPPPVGEDGGDGEPAFQSEWQDADTSLELVGRACLSMLSGTVQVCLKEWERQLGLSCRVTHKAALKNGFLRGYQACFGEGLGIDWDKCPADLAIIEQVTLARNRDQHPETISTFSLNHSKDDWKKHPRPFFSDDFPEGAYDEESYWLTPRLRVPGDKLLHAIDQVGVLGKWLNEQVAAAYERFRSQGA